MINLGDLLEEIALEGLAGCRLDDLWQRLDRRGLSISTEAKDSVWNVLRDGSQGVAFYVTTGESSDLTEEKECKPKRSSGIMGLDAVSDPVTGDRGICNDYARRQNISHLVSEISLSKVIEKWGDSLVMVASQDLRLSSLVGPYFDPCFVLLNNEYIALEVIGKYRFNGITRIELAKVLGVNAKTVFHPVRGLSSKRLIKERKELEEKRLTTRIYLTRFYRESEDKLQQWKRLCNFLAKQPDKTADFKEINSIVFSNDTSAFKQARQLLVRNGTVKKLQSPKTNSPSLTLIQHVDNDVESASDSEEQNPELTRDCTSETMRQGRVYPARWMDNKAIAEKSFITQLYEHIEAAGSQGVTQQEMAVHYGIGQLYVRSGLKVLQHTKVLGKFVQDKGRQQTDTHVALLPIRKISGNTDRTEAESHTEIKTSQSGGEPHKDPNHDVSINRETLRMGGQTLIDTRSTWLKGLIEKHKVVHGLTPMSIGLREYETKQGRTHIVCRKTVHRLVSQLIKAGEIDVVTTDVSGQSCRFYMSKGLTTADEAFQTALHHVQLSFDRGKTQKSKKLSAMTVKKQKSTRKAEQADNPDVAKLLMESHVEGVVDSASVERLQEDISQQTAGLLDTKTATVQRVHQRVKQTKIKQDGVRQEQHSSESEGARKFTLMPKFHRFRTLHKFLWQGLCQPPGDSTNALMLPCSSKGEGWVLLSVAFNHMPVQSFLGSIGFIGNSIELETFLKDPKNADVAMKDLPPTLLTTLCARQPHVYGIMYELIRRLEAMSLLRTESVSDTEHHGNAHLFVEQSHVLLDTKLAKPTYCQLQWGEVKSFQRLEYSFQNLSNVNQFWFDLERICATTSMGRRNLRTDQEKTKCRIRYASIKRLDFDELQDDDVVGAAGLPWQLFPHVRRSWTNAIHQSSTAASAAATVAPEHYTWTTSVKDTKQTKKVRVVVQPGKKLNEERKGGKGYKRVRPIGEQGNVAKRIKVLKKVSQVKKKQPQKKSRMIRDTGDQEARSLKKTLRVSFTKQEDNLVVICGAAKDFVKKRFGYDPPWVEIRNVYREVAGLVASDKTSFAIQRRLAYIRRCTLVLSLKLQTLLCELEQEEEFKKIGKKNFGECLKIYKDLVVKIWRKHGGKLLVSPLLPAADIPALPESLTQLLSEYTVSYDDSKSGSGEMKSVSQIDDSDPVSVRRSILKDILMCAYAEANVQVEFSSYQLYQLLQSYPQEDLEAVYEEFKARNYLTKKRNYKGDDCAYPTYLTLASAYHRPFSVHYPREVFSSAMDIDSLPVIEHVPLPVSEVSEHSLEQQISMDVDSVPVVDCVQSAVSSEVSENRHEEQVSKDSDKDRLKVGEQTSEDRHRRVLDLSQMNGCCVANLLPKMFSPEVVVDARLPDSLFDVVDNSGRKTSEKPEMEADMSSDDDEPRNEDNKKDRKTWTESLQDHLCVSEHIEANDSLITISSHVTQIKGPEKADNLDCSNTVDNGLNVPKWCVADASTDLELDAGFENSCISDEELVTICQELGWQAVEVADLMVVLSEVRQSGWQGIEKQFLLKSSAMQQKCQSSMPISNMIQTLLNFGMVHTVGFTAQRLVCHESCQSWHFEAVSGNPKEESTGSKLEEQEHQQDSTQPASCKSNREAKHLVAARPWITCSGTLNVHHLTYSLQAVLNQIMCKPGIAKDTVQKAMGGVIHPAAVEDLLHLLEIAQCIQVQVMQETEKPSLFSTPHALLPGNDPTRSVAHLFATADCLSRLAKAVNNEGKTD